MSRIRIQRNEAGGANKRAAMTTGLSAITTANVLQLELKNLDLARTHPSMNPQIGITITIAQ